MSWGAKWKKEDGFHLEQSEKQHVDSRSALPCFSESGQVEQSFSRQQLSNVP